MSGSVPFDDLATGRSADRLVGRLKIYFAILSCLGGLVLTAGSETESLPVIAVFFAVFGYVFVDSLELFALPPIAAYAAMGLAALYCVSDFVDLDAPGNHQMVAVAQLLVFVQAILMLQRKSRRIFEQLGVFCLLELIVAAVFNNAMNYGLLLIPISLIGAWALSLLAALSASEGIDQLGGLERDDDSIGFLRRVPSSSVITITARESAESLTAAGLRLPRIAMLTLAPSVLLVGAIFFYALPRTTDAARVSNRGNALVGFADELRMEQIGQMMQSSQTALCVHIADRATGLPYVVHGGIYLRGRVLERYSARLSGEKNTAVWSAIPVGLITGFQSLPQEYYPQRTTDQNFYDAVNVNVICESMRSSALFSIAPYYRLRNDPDVVHYVDRWTLARRSKDDWVFPRTSYTFGTHAFRSGVQTDLVGRWSQGESMMSTTNDIASRTVGDSRNRADNEKRAENYVDELLWFNIDAMPTAAKLAERFTHSPRGQRPTDYQIAKAMERFLATNGDFSYTLNLNAESLPGVDPIEQFLSVDRRGHCQYFASALAMMLRSVDIPSRIVVGYHTEEFNEFGNHYVARQLHAHAWVEALIEHDQLNPNQTVYGQPPADQYWLRLDPTPGGGRVRASAGGVGQVIDIAQNIWDDYVVEMDGDRQDNSLLGGARINPLNRSYESLVDSLSKVISSIRAGELGGGSLARRELFSWPAAVLGIVATLLTVVLLRLRVPQWIKRRIRREASTAAARPSIRFYAETLDQLSRVGVVRSASQTPQELAVDAAAALQHFSGSPISGPLHVLTQAFYRFRFGGPKAELDLEVNGTIEHARLRSPEIDSALVELTRSMDLMAASGKQVERAS